MYNPARHARSSASSAPEHIRIKSQEDTRTSPRWFLATTPTLAYLKLSTKLASTFILIYSRSGGFQTTRSFSFCGLRFSPFPITPFPLVLWSTCTREYRGADYVEQISWSPCSVLLYLCSQPASGCAEPIICFLIRGPTCQWKRKRPTELAHLSPWRDGDTTKKIHFRDDTCLS